MTQLPLPKLLKKTQDVFNKFIRERDKGRSCISCGRYTTLQAGHFFSAGKYSALRFEEDNVHGQCLQCNYFLHGNLLSYQTNLINKIGNERFHALQFKADIAKRNRFHRWDRVTLEHYQKIYTLKK